VLDEAGWVGSMTTPGAKPVLEGRERANPAGELDPCPPSRRRDVHPSGPRPPRDEQATEHHEENKSEMEDNRGVGENAEAHDGTNVAQPSLTSWRSSSLFSRSTIRFATRLSVCSASSRVGFFLMEMLQMRANKALLGPFSCQIAYFHRRIQWPAGRLSALGKQSRRLDSRSRRLPVRTAGPAPPVRVPGEVREQPPGSSPPFCVTEGEAAARVEEARRSGGSRRVLPAGRRDQ
jgi:hypothetical protein